MNWPEYIERVSKEGEFLKGIILDCRDGEIEFPELIRTSVLLLEKMLKHQGKYNVFVFPEVVETAFLFAIAKLIFNIESGKITGTYNPHLFKEGQKLKLGNSIVKFKGIIRGKDIKDNDSHFENQELYILVSTKDQILNYMKLDSAPYFQLVDDSRSLSTDKAFSKAKKLIGIQDNGDIDIIDKLQQLKTHYDGTVFYVTNVERAKKNAESYSLNGKRVRDIFYIAMANYKGKTVNIVPGKLKGIPALTLTYSLENILEAMNKGLKVQSVIIDLSSVNIETQTDNLDELMSRDIPVVCLADTLNSFDNVVLKERRFNFWRWNKNSLTTKLTGEGVIRTNRKAINCYSGNTVYLVAESEQAAEISNAFTLISSHRGEVENLSAKCDKVFQGLMRLAYRSLRSIEVYDEVVIYPIEEYLNKCEEILKEESRYLPNELHSDFGKAIEIFKRIFVKNYEFPKITVLRQYLLSNKPEKIDLIIGRDSDKQKVIEQWRSRLSKHGYAPDILAHYPEEFSGLIPDSSTATIIAGWFSKKTIRNILYSYNSGAYIILLYANEKKWKKYHTREWNRELCDECNQQAIEKSFEASIKASKQNKIKIDTVNLDTMIDNHGQIQDEQEDIDLVLQQRIYNRYITKGERSGRSDVLVKAYLVVYNGGYFSYYTESHKSIVVTEILEGRSESINNAEIKDLKIGDWVVVRESSKDIIREVADTILQESKMEDQRALSSEWKEALLRECKLYDREIVVDKIQKAGCTKEKQTIRNWFVNENMIIPQSKKDLEIIAKVTGDKELIRKIDSVFTAGKNVDRAHKKAGRVLSNMLKTKIVNIIAEDNSFEANTNLDPIEFQIEGIGVVKLLKIISLGAPIEVSNINTNRLFMEESEATTWL